jgi:hypothetical protein
MVGALTLPRIAALMSALVGGIALSCVPELPRGKSCGDGWWDPEHEECDPSSPDDSYLSACRDRGLGSDDAHCDPLTCEIIADEQSCIRCGDGIASGSEQCDGHDLRGAKCSNGSDVVRCTDECTLDYELCPPVCGDGVVSGTEECEPALSCATDNDCGPGRRCYTLFGECVPDHGFGLNLSCSFYKTTAVGINKPYASGTIERCTSTCAFGRDKCGFCGDGELDDAYFDRVYPSGNSVSFPAEVCDGNQARTDALEAYCRPLCVKEAVNADVVVFCDFQCNAACDGFSPPVDVIVPGDDPAALGCCLAKNSPCPNFDKDGVPKLPCCSWLDNPEWMAEQKCVASNTNQVPVSMVCP